MQPFEQLEHEWAHWNDLNPAEMVACSSGTAALHLALEALELPLGSHVLVPDFTMIACPRAVTLAALEPVFVDCDSSLLLDTGLLYDDKPRRSVEKLADCIMVVHVYGRRCNMENIVDVSADWECPVVEDLAEAHGVRPHSLTDAACWSFYRNKIVAGEEGGAIWFRDPKRAELARSLRSMGFTEAHDYTHRTRGHNYRMSNLHAKPILRSIQDWGHNVFGPGGRREIEAWYEEACPVEWRMPARDAPWVYDLRIPGMSSEVQGRVVTELRAEGIEARHGFKPMHEQEEYRGCQRVGGEQADMASREVVYLPISPGKTTREDCRRAFEVIRRIVG